MGSRGILIEGELVRRVAGSNQLDKVVDQLARQQGRNEVAGFRFDDESSPSPASGSAFLPVAGPKKHPDDFSQTRLCAATGS